MEVLPLTGGDRPPATLIERLRDGGLVCLVADRDLTRRGIAVDFFGAEARMPAGPAALAVATGAILLPVVAVVHDDRTGGHDPSRGADRRDRAAAGRRVATTTQAIANVFEREIAKHPDGLAHAPAAVARRSPAGPAPAGTAIRPRRRRTGRTGRRATKEVTR